jgi:hypothetical protein
MNLDLERKAKRQRPERPGRSGSHWGRLLLGLFFVVAISYTVYVPPARSIREPGLKPGDIAASDIVVRKEMTVEDKEASEQNRRKALAGVVPVYEFNEQKTAGSQMLLAEWFRFFKEARREHLLGKADLAAFAARVRENFGIELAPPALQALVRGNTFAKIALEQLLLAARQWGEQGIILSRIGVPRGADGAVTVYSERKGYAPARLEQFLDLKDVEGRLAAQLRAERLGEREIEIVMPILLDFISTNVSYSKVLTRLEEEKALALANPVFIHLKKGRVVLRSGDEVSRDHMRLIQLIAAEETTGTRRVPGVLLILASLGVLFFFFWRLNALAKTGGINRARLNFVSGMTFIACALIYRLALFLYPLVLKNLAFRVQIEGDVLAYGIPFAVGSLIIAFLFDLQSAVVFSFINAVIGAFACDGDFRILLYVLAGNLAAAFGIEFYQRLKRSSVFKAAFFWLLPVNLAITLLFALSADGGGWLPVAFTVLLGVMAALLSAFVANFLIPLWEVMFKLVTDLKLVELSNLNLPCFREMLEKAPGTYHHSQMVATLAEAAAQELELSPLLLRAMALYHDIGKVDNPQFFTENQSLYEDPHAQLAPLESAKIIISHIPLGLEKAERLKLPRQVALAISQHHGNKLVKFFHARALELNAGRLDGFDENMFRYPGKKPQQVEAAIIMLADQVEAASKSLSAPGDQDIRNVVEKIVASDIAENQFDECDGLTFKALNVIARSFYDKLASIYHQRVSYPGFDFSKAVAP